MAHETKKINTAELIKEIHAELPDNAIDFADMLADYSGYICDAISEKADAQVDIYYHDLTAWLSECSKAPELMQEVIDDCLVDIRNYDFYNHVQCAQYMAIYNALYEAFNSDKQNIFTYWILSDIEKQHPEIKADHLLGLYNLIEVVETDSRIEDVLEDARAIFEDEQE